MIVLGIDPGTTSVGYAVLKKGRKRIKVLSLNFLDTQKEKDKGKKLIKIYQETKKMIRQYNPDIIGVEQIYFFKNAKTMVQITQAQGAIFLAAFQSRKRVLEVTPLQVKSLVTGYGRADKTQVQKMLKEILNLKEIPKPDDVADAIGIALYCILTS